MDIFLSNRQNLRSLENQIDELKLTVSGLELGSTFNQFKLVKIFKSFKNLGN